MKVSRPIFPSFTDLAKADRITVFSPMTNTFHT